MYAHALYVYAPMQMFFFPFPQQLYGAQICIGTARGIQEIQTSFRGETQVSKKCRPVHCLLSTVADWPVEDMVHKREQTFDCAAHGVLDCSVAPHCLEGIFHCFKPVVRQDDGDCTSRLV
jgi:hypothetical protein